MSRRTPGYARISEAQANAEALTRRGLPYTAASAASIEVRWDWQRRAPTDLRDAVRQVRRAYADEVPTKLHDGPGVIGQDGTPRMTARAEGYIFGHAESDDAGRDPETGKRDMMGYYHAPFRATLSRMARGDACARRRARIVAHVTIGQEPPRDAAMREGAHPLDAVLVADDALRAFLRSLSDVRIHVNEAQVLPENMTAA